MSRVAATFLDLSTPGGIVQRRWQSRWIYQPMTWDGQPWYYRGFDWSGISSGAVIDASPATLSFPMLAGTLRDLERAHEEQWVGRVRAYAYPEGLTITSGPTADTILIGQFSGVLSLTSASQDVISITLGGEAGGTFPPRVADSALIGVPCELGER
jgi:hypothetical protein